MTQLGEETQKSGANAASVSVIAAEWIQRRQFWDWSDKDQAELDAWLAEASLNLVTFLRLEAAWNRTERLAALNRTFSSISEPENPRTDRSFLVRIAAVIIVIGLGAGVTWSALRPEENTYATPVGVHETISLADGSQIELNTDSVLHTRSDPVRRLVTLEKGEAFFRIKHDAAHPFVVLANGHRITDLGTKFVVRETEVDAVEVSVLEGSARLDAENAEFAVLKAGDVAVANTHSLVLEKGQDREIANALAWRRGMLVFSQTPLSNVAKELNRYNAKKLIIADREAGKTKIGGTFPTDGIDEVTAAARLLFGLRVEDRGNEIVISR